MMEFRRVDTVLQKSCAQMVGVRVLQRNLKRLQTAITRCRLRKPITRINNTGWKEARKKAGLEFVRVHDLKHTFGRRLRSVGICFEDRQDLLGHRSGRITTHYSSAELQNLYEAANKVCEKQQSGVVLTLLRNPKNRKEKGTTQSGKVVSL